MHLRLQRILVLTLDQVIGDSTKICAIVPIITPVAQSQLTVFTSLRVGAGTRSSNVEWSSQTA